MDLTTKHGPLNTDPCQLSTRIFAVETYLNHEYLYYIMLVNLSDRTFLNEISRRKEAIVLFYATWCGFCRTIKPTFETISKNDKREFILVDISNEDSSLWDDFKIEVVPTIIQFKNGLPGKRISGVLTAEHLKKFLAEL